MNRVTTRAELDQALESGRRTAVMFHATWCPFCRAFVPVFAKTMGRVQGIDALEAVIDDEENPLWEQYGIEAVPTVIFFENGKPVHRVDAELGVGLTDEHLRRGLAKVGVGPQNP